jgi:hypothetical protein
VCVMYMCYNVYIYMDICMLGVNDEPDKMDMGILISFYTFKMRVRRRRVKDAASYLETSSKAVLNDRF